MPRNAVSGSPPTSLPRSATSVSIVSTASYRDAVEPVAIGVIDAVVASTSSIQERLAWGIVGVYAVRCEGCYGRVDGENEG